MKWQKVIEGCLDRLAEQHGDILYRLSEIKSLVKHDNSKELAELDGRIRAMFLSFCERRPDIMEGYEHIHDPLYFMFQHLMVLAESRFYRIRELQEEVLKLKAPPLERR